MVEDGEREENAMKVPMRDGREWKRAKIKVSQFYAELGNLREKLRSIFEPRKPLTTGDDPLTIGVRSRNRIARIPMCRKEVVSWLLRAILGYSMVVVVRTDYRERWRRCEDPTFHVCPFDPPSLSSSPSRCLNSSGRRGMRSVQQRVLADSDRLPRC